MRTTLTLDDDLAAALRHRCKMQALSWRQVVNETLRRGLTSEPAPRQPFGTEPYDPGPPRLVGVHSVHELLVFAEGEDYR